MTEYEKLSLQLLSSIASATTVLVSHTVMTAPKSSAQHEKDLQAAMKMSTTAINQVKEALQRNATQ